MKTGSIIRGDNAVASSVRALSLDGESGTGPRGSNAGNGLPAQTISPDPELVKLREALASSEARHAQQLARAREQGREDAAAAFKRDEASALAALEAGIAASIAAFQREIRGLERLALALCDTALAKVLGDPGRRADLVSGALEDQLNLVKTDSIVTVRVSTADFPDKQALSRLAERLHLLPGTVEQRSELRAGDCDILMRLGHIELSIPDYLLRLRQALAEAGHEARHPG